LIELPRRWSEELEELGRLAEGEHQLTNRSARQTLDHAIRCGEYLAEAKAKVAHGQWLHWIRDHLSYGPRKCQKYMFLAQNREELLRRYDSESHLPLERALQMLRHMPEVPEYAQRPPTPLPPAKEYSYTVEPAKEQTEPRQVTVDPVRAIQAAAYLPYGEVGTVALEFLRSARRALVQIDASDEWVRRLDRLINDIVQRLERDALDR
jgi:hypothetical protein